jgi:glyoxylase-like metal-dependent hydrolase (beta-lactamase superfamily II)
MVVIAGSKPVLVDSGYGSDLTRTEGLIGEQGLGLAGLSLVVNTHYHSDHVGGNAGLQGSYGVPSRRIAGRPRWSTAAIRRPARRSGWTSLWSRTG